MHRRHFLATASLPLLGCTPTREITGGFTGIAFERGHQLRDTRSWPAPSITHRTEVLIAGGGVAGLAAARALRLKGVEDFALLELEDSAGGNSRGGMVGGIACPLGAHYLPVPSDDAPEVQNLLEEFGLRRRVAGRWEYEERHLCHSPQERLFFRGAWQDGLLPLQGVGATTLAQYQKMATLVEQLRQQSRWTIPALKTPFTQVQHALAAITFAAYLAQNGLDDPQLLWYLDYCCRDDYGAGLTTVSAWAGIHYFASRHGFHAPGADSGERDSVLTWPEGNAWLTRRLAAPLGERLRTGQVVVRIAETRDGVEVDAYNSASHALERWQARRAIVALPVFIAARVVQNPPDFLTQAAGRTRYAPWLVANIHIDTPLHDRPGPAPSWDNVLYNTPGLGYVDAMHQSLQSVPGATVLSYYRPLGDVPDGRRLLLEKPWAAWRDEILAELGTAHPDIASKTRRIDITRYGHAMAIPTPELSSQIGLQRTLHLRQQLQKTQRLSFAHSDWAGYSVFEEAFTLGHAAA
ncbi:FAD-dependent oxidoreductase [Rhodoferax sp.]|uniref:FAD-dependent oxidoreductase n=1 Tax=Rhodoferax sp. TaxID=50421 RepID=UPI00374D3F44